VLVKVQETDPWRVLHPIDFCLGHFNFKYRH
jgi:hypothetical protein